MRPTWPQGLQRRQQIQLFVLLALFSAVAAQKLPLVLNTWKFTEATATAYTYLTSVSSPTPRLDAIEKGCSICEVKQCDGSVGYGGNPDASGEVTLDAMIMDGPTHDVGAVGYLRRIKSAISVARAVLVHSKHSLVVGDGATAFAKMMGFVEEPLNTQHSDAAHESWVANNCQPNYYMNFINDTTQCPPYPQPVWEEEPSQHWYLTPQGRRMSSRFSPPGVVRQLNHDTIGMVVVDANGNLACGTSTNGLGGKVPGRVGDSPLPGSGCYVDNEVGGAAGTGDGDTMLRFAPAAMAVEWMRHGLSPQSACEKAIERIAKAYPAFTGGLVCANKRGEYGAAGYGWTLSYAVQSPDSKGQVQTFSVPPLPPAHAAASM